MPTFKLPELSYSYDALEPYIDARTMEIHHSKHHAAYVAKLNGALEQAPQAGDSSIEQVLQNLASLPEAVQTAVRNNGGGHANHTLFWQIMAKGKGGQASGQIGDAISKRFGSFDAFREQFSTAAATRFGSGWAWLSLDSSGELAVHSTANQDNPLLEGKTPLMGLDVWEHAYYLKYQNRRPEYIEAWWSVVDWSVVNDNYLAARG